MNDLARDVLVEASLRGIQQVKGMFMGHAVDMVCAQGALHLAEHEWDWEKARLCREQSTRANQWSLDLPWFYQCGWVQTYELNKEEGAEIIDANDDKGWDFLQISRKCCLGEAEAQEA